MFETLYDPKMRGSFRQPLALPTSDPDAGNQICVQFSEAWLPPVLGALMQLLQDTAWDTTDPDALTLAQARANQLIYQFQEAVCPMFDVRIDPENNCMLQKTVDGGATWQDVGSFYYCAKGAAADEITNEIADGILATRGQQPPGGTVPPAECRSYHVQLRGNDRWLCPTPVSAGYTVHITNASGGWWDGNTGIVGWQCPDGKCYTLGACGAAIPYYSGDPYQGGNHMQLVANVASTWADPLSALWVVPAGIVAQPLYIQANDAPLSDNQGSVQFDIEVCSIAWEHEFDFTTGQHGWTPIDYYGSHTFYTPNVGFQDYACIDSNDSFCVIGWAFEQVVDNIDGAIATIWKSTLSDDMRAGAGWNNAEGDQGHLGVSVPASQTPTDVPLDFTGSSITHLYMKAQVNEECSGATITLAKLLFSGHGVDPFL